MASVVIPAAGRATSGTTVSQETALQFQEGVSPEAEIISRLGQHSKVPNTDYMTTIVYVSTGVNIHSVTFILLLGCLLATLLAQTEQSSSRIRRQHTSPIDANSHYGAVFYTPKCASVRPPGLT